MYSTNPSGCIDSYACNYSLDAIEDDGSCVYADLGYDYSMNFYNDFVDFGTINNFPQSEFTISFWEKFSDSSDQQTVFSYASTSTDNECVLMYISTGLKFYLAGHLPLTLSAPHSTNIWDYVTITWDSSNGEVFFYRNGTLQTQATYQQNLTLSSSGYLVLGQEQDSYGGTFQSSQALHGSLDNIQIWNTVLSQDDIQDYMNCPPTGNEAGLVSYWNFENGCGPLVYDKTENGNDGELNGATWSTDTPEQNCPSYCTDPASCNYNPDAIEDDGSCIYADCAGVCGGNTIVDCEGVCGGNAVMDECDICDDDTSNDCTQDCNEIWGGTALIDECGVCGGSGIPLGYCDCNGNQLDAVNVCGGDCTDDYDGDGICDNQEIYGCTYNTASNFHSEATADDGSCEFPAIDNCPSDLDGNGIVATNDLLLFLAAYGSSCE